MDPREPVNYLIEATRPSHPLAEAIVEAVRGHKACLLTDTISIDLPFLLTIEGEYACNQFENRDLFSPQTAGLVCPLLSIA